MGRLTATEKLILAEARRIKLRENAILGPQGGAESLGEALLNDAALTALDVAIENELLPVEIPQELFAAVRRDERGFKATAVDDLLASLREDGIDADGGDTSVADEVYGDFLDEAFVVDAAANHITDAPGVLEGERSIGELFSIAREAVLKAIDGDPDRLADRWTGAFLEYGLGL